MSKVTFDELCPEWNEALVKSKKFKEVTTRMNMGDYRFCIVGEAHNWSNNYRYSFDENTRCRECVVAAGNFSNFADGDNTIYDFDNCNTDFEIYNNEGFEATKKRFMKHWNEKHV